MSKGRKISLTLIAVMAAAMLAVALLPALSSTSTREVTLVARNMAFYLDGDRTAANPTIEVKAGERVRVVLRNEDRGLRHDFAVPAVKAAMELVEWSESAEVVFEVPETPGTYTYECRPHRLMMRGTIRVY
jgi:plastocyanin